MRVHPNATLVVVGVGEMDHQLRRLASELGVSEHVRFLGSVSDKSLVDFYRRATLVAMPTSRLETGFCAAARMARPSGVKRKKA